MICESFKKSYKNKVNLPIEVEIKIEKYDSNITEGKYECVERWYGEAMNPYVQLKLLPNKEMVNKEKRAWKILLSYVNDYLADCYGDIGLDDNLIPEYTEIKKKCLAAMKKVIHSK